jgi:hypothetical protein
VFAGETDGWVVDMENFAPPGMSLPDFLGYLKNQGDTAHAVAGALLGATLLPMCLLLYMLGNYS